MVENIDYRVDHKAKKVYVRKGLKSASYQEGTKVHEEVERWFRKKYHIEHGYTDEFIRNARKNESPF